MGCATRLVSAVLLKRVFDAEGNATSEFQVATVTEWFTFSKDTTVSAEVMERDLDEVEKEYEMSQQAGVVSAPCR